MHITLEKNEAVQIMPLEYPRTESPYEVIGGLVPKDELLCQLAEEATELAQAALKMRRTLSNVNPTPTTRRQAEDALLEEIADVKLCLHVAGLESCSRKIKVNRIIGSKAERWLKRLEEKR